MKQAALATRSTMAATILQSEHLEPADVGLHLLHVADVEGVDEQGQGAAAKLERQGARSEADGVGDERRDRIGAPAQRHSDDPGVHAMPRGDHGASDGDGRLHELGDEVQREPGGVERSNDDGAGAPGAEEADRTCEENAAEHVGGGHVGPEGQPDRRECDDVKEARHGASTSST
jgi:hypothetical protein